MGKNLKSLFTLQKKNYGWNKKRQLKLTNIKITQNNKSKIETTTTSKNEETKKNLKKYNFQRKKLMLSDKNRLSLVAEGPLQNLF